MCLLELSTPVENPRQEGKYRGGDPALGHTPLILAELMDEGVRVQLESGPMETYDFVVGADGVHSAVRRAVLPADNLRRSLMTEASWRFTAPNPGVDCWPVWSGAQGTFLLIPVDEQQVLATPRPLAAARTPQATPRIAF
jgi:2-polyprenyl-6-methoxyphenol hydroxylase-like FAD-dependent oxidoreductase